MSKKPRLVNENPVGKSNSLEEKQPENSKALESNLEMPKGWDSDIPLDAYEERQEFLAKPEVVTAVVTDDKKGRKPRAPAGAKKESDKRLPMPVIERFAQEMINKGDLAPNFTVWIPEVGEPQVLEKLEETKTVRVCAVEKMAAVLVNQLCGVYEDYAVTFSEAISIVKRWRWNCVHTLEKWPIPVAFKTSKEICFSRLSFDPAKSYVSSDMPIMIEILNRMSNSKPFCQMIGACFYPDTSRKQAVWLFGQSDSGKSFLLNHVIAKVCGGKEGTATFSGESLKGAHWKEPLIGKSLLVVNEASAEFLGNKNGAFKSLTGDDLHMINPKGLKMFQGRLDCRVFFSSNDAPEIPNDDALKNRLVVCKMTAFKGLKIPPRELEVAVEKELPFFVAMCMDLFKRSGGEINPTSEDLDDAIEDYQSSLQYVFDCCFEVVPGAKLSVHEFTARLKSGDHLRDGITLNSLRTFMRNNYQISSRRDGSKNNKTPMYFPNLREKHHGGHGGQPSY